MGVDPACPSHCHRRARRRWLVGLGPAQPGRNLRQPHTRVHHHGGRDNHHGDARPSPELAHVRLRQRPHALEPEPAAPPAVHPGVALRRAWTARVPTRRRRRIAVRGADPRALLRRQHRERRARLAQGHWPLLCGHPGRRRRHRLRLVPRRVPVPEGRVRQWWLRLRLGCQDRRAPLGGRTAAGRILAPRTGRHGLRGRVGQEGLRARRGDRGHQVGDGDRRADRVVGQLDRCRLRRRLPGDRDRHERRQPLCARRGDRGDPLEGAEQRAPRQRPRVLLRHADGRLRPRLHRQYRRLDVRLRGAEREADLGQAGRHVRLYRRRGRRPGHLHRHL